MPFQHGHADNEPGVDKLSKGLGVLPLIADQGSPPSRPAPSHFLFRPSPVVGGRDGWRRAPEERQLRRTVSSGQHPAIISPFQFADPSYYPEPLAETVKQDVRRIAKTQSSRSATEHSGQVPAIDKAHEPKSLSGAALKARLSRGGSLKSRTSAILLTRTSSNVSAPASTSNASRSSISQRSSYTSGYEEAVNQGYALPSTQGVSRRTWNETGTVSVADRIASQAAKLNGSKPSILGQANTSIIGGRHRSMDANTCMGMAQGPAPAKGVRGVLEAIFG